MSQILEPSAQENWVLMANAFRAGRAQGEQGRRRQGGRTSVESNSLHIWKELRTQVAEMHWVRALPGTLPHVLPVPSTASLYSEKCVT